CTLGSCVSPSVDLGKLIIHVRLASGELHEFVPRQVRTGLRGITDAWIQALIMEPPYNSRGREGGEPCRFRSESLGSGSRDSSCSKWAGASGESKSARSTAPTSNRAPRRRVV